MRTRDCSGDPSRVLVGAVTLNCCAPGSQRGSIANEPRDRSDPTATRLADDGVPSQLIEVPGGTYVMGERSALANAADGEEPVEVAVSSFHLQATTVTNEHFARFVEETSYCTTAERVGSSFVFAGLLPEDFGPTRGVASAPWWREVEGACWSAPEGPQSDIAGRGDRPVVHVSLFDAVAYADWCGLRLPSEAEWERAARAGTDTVWPWGDDREPGGRHAMNVWQGAFPTHDEGADGYVGTAPVRAFEPNPWGLWNMVGNVWEWTVDDFGVRFAGGERTGRRAFKGGSFLCHASYCNRYRPSGRIGLPPESTAGNVGFRCASSITATDRSAVAADHDKEIQH